MWLCFHCFVLSRTLKTTCATRISWRRSGRSTTPNTTLVCLSVSVHLCAVCASVCLCAFCVSVCLCVCVPTVRLCAYSWYYSTYVRVPMLRVCSAYVCLCLMCMCVVCYCVYVRIWLSGVVCVCTYVRTHSLYQCCLHFCYIRT